MAETLYGLAASKSKSMGGEVSAQLIAAAFGNQTRDLDDTKLELTKTRKKLDDTNAELSSAKANNAVLRERLDNLGAIRHAKNLAIAIGTLLLGQGFKFIVDSLVPFGVGLFVVGALMIVLAWFSAPPKSQP